MFCIRSRVFETNSSSCHSVSVHKQGLDRNIMPIDKTDNKIHVKLGEFGWDWIAYPEQMDKLSYLVTMLMHLNGFSLWNAANKAETREMLDELMKSDEFERLSDEVGSYAGCDGVYIDTSYGELDHQGYEDFSSLQMLLSHYNVDSFVEFIFDSGVVVKTGNDNGGAPFGWYDEEDDDFDEASIEDMAGDLIESVMQFAEKAKHKTNEKNGKNIIQYQDKIIDYIQKITKKTQNTREIA